MTDAGLTQRLARQLAGRHLYVLFGVHTRRCKIGSSSDVLRRFTTIRATNADDLVLWCWAADHGKHECDLHAYFSEFRLHGEWFSSEVTSIISREVDQLDVSSERFAKLCRRWVRANEPSAPPCPGCGSRTEPVWRRVGNRNMARCPSCNRCRRSLPIGKAT